MEADLAVLGRALEYGHEPAAEDATAMIFDAEVPFIDAELQIRPARAPNLPSQYNGALDGAPMHPFIGLRFEWISSNVQYSYSCISQLIRSQYFLMCDIRHKAETSADSG